VVAMVLRHGLGAESLAWAVIFAITPLSGVYYPVKVLPTWLQPLAKALPSTHVFEGMRAVMIEHTFRYDLLANAAALNTLYLLVGGAVFLAAFHAARKRDLLLHVGE